MQQRMQADLLEVGSKIEARFGAGPRFFKGIIAWVQAETEVGGGGAVFGSTYTVSHIQEKHMQYVYLSYNFRY